MKEKKIFFRFSCFCLIITLALLVCYGLGGCFKRDYNEVFLHNWKIKLPENMKEEFRKSEDNWWGDGVRYAVFKLATEPTDFVADFAREKNEKFESTVDKHLKNAQFKIDKKYLPNWNSVYFSKHVTREEEENGSIYYDDCYIIYFPETSRLVICQYFS